MLCDDIDFSSNRSRIFCTHISVPIFFYKIIVKNFLDNWMTF